MSDTGIKPSTKEEMRKQSLQIVTRILEIAEKQREEFAAMESKQGIQWQEDLEDISKYE